MSSVAKYYVCNRKMDNISIMIICRTAKYLKHYFFSLIKPIIHFGRTFLVMCTENEYLVKIRSIEFMTGMKVMIGYIWEIHFTKKKKYICPILEKRMRV